MDLELQEQQEHHHHHHHHHHHSGHHRHHHSHHQYGSSKAVKMTKGQRVFKTVTTLVSIVVLFAIIYLAGKEIGASIYEWIQY